MGAWGGASGAGSFSMASCRAEIRLMHVWMASRESSLSVKRSGRSQVRVERPGEGDVEEYENVREKGSGI